MMRLAWTLILILCGCQSPQPMAYRAELKGALDAEQRESFAVTITIGNGG